MLIALGGSAAFSDAHGPLAPAQPAIVPTVAVAVTDAQTVSESVGNQWSPPTLTTVSVSVAH
jgi:hypothetical protein